MKIMNNPLCNLSNIKDILNRHGFNFKKSLGQNFLINSAVPEKIASSAEIDGINVIEIGPGIGTLTTELAKRAKKVVCIELDSKLIPVLNETLSEFSNIKVINDDILKVDLKNLIENEFKNEKVAIVANLPYYITTPVIMKLLEEKLAFESITVMIQKEVAKRLTAKPGTSDFGAITLSVAYYSNPKILFYVSPGSFIPAPKVESAVMKFVILKEPPVSCDEQLLKKIIKAAFSQRRKTLINSLSTAFPKSLCEEAIKYVGFNQNIRGERLSLEDFSQICEFLKIKTCKN